MNGNIPSMRQNSPNGNKHTLTTAPELVRALMGKCGMVRGPIEPPLLKICFRPKATGNRQQATGNRQQATGNRF
jgi:hypothetical protein